MATTKKRASSHGAATAQDTLRRDALRFFHIVNDESVPSDVRHELASYLDEVVNNAPSADWINNQARFLRCFVESAQDGLPLLISEIIRRLNRGETAEQIIRDIESRRKQVSEKCLARILAKPEPKDKTSDEWRYWKLRHMEQAFQGSGDREAYRQAWDEFEALLMGLMRDEDFWHVNNALALLPHLIIARQEIDRMNARDKRSKAAMKAAQTRAAQKGAR